MNSIRISKLCMCSFYPFLIHRKAQARFSFATYLTRVQYRLMSETSKNVGAEDLELANEQMVGVCLKYYSRKRICLFSIICSHVTQTLCETAHVPNSGCVAMLEIPY